MIFVDSVCQRCKGSGWVFPKGICPDCQGYGMTGRVLVDIPVNIPRRVRQTPFGRRLRQWREKRKLTFREVSEVLGPWCGESVPPSRLSDIERGKVFPRQVSAKKALGADEEDKVMTLREEKKLIITLSRQYRIACNKGECPFPEECPLRRVIPCHEVKDVDWQAYYWRQIDLSKMERGNER